MAEPANTKDRARGFAYRNAMIGRDEELAELEKFVSAIHNDEPKFPGVMRLLGEPGIGKTRLVAALRAKLEESGQTIQWVAIPCDSVHKSGWNAVSTWLRAWLRVTDSATQAEKRTAIETRYAEFANNDSIPESTRTELRRTQSFVADLVDCHWDDSPFANVDDPKLRYENRIIAMKELLRAMATTAPTVLEVEDTHWIDSSTAAWMAAMTRNIEDLPLAIIATSRFEDDGGKPDLHVADKAGLKDLELKPVTGDGFIKAMAAALLGADTELDAETARLISGKSKGNPFFAEQLILHLHETGELEQATESSTQRICLSVKRDAVSRLPDNLSSLVTARIDRLSPDVRETVKHASILGARFLSQALGELLNRSGKVSRGLEELLIESEREGVLVNAERVKGNENDT